MKQTENTFKTKNYGDLVVIKYINHTEVVVKFVETGYETVTHMSQVRNGQVKDRLLPTAFGVGVVGDEITKVNGKFLKEYDLWRGMLRRCYDTNLHKRRSTYLNCTVSDNFKHYPFFKGWCSKQIGFGNENWHLDKDILVKGNKVYSEDTCCFVPPEINILLTSRKSKIGNCLIGVSYRKAQDKFIARVDKAGKTQYLGTFTTEMEAFQAYKEAKEAYIKELANKWKDQIDSRVYEVLMNWEVLEND